METLKDKIEAMEAEILKADERIEVLKQETADRIKAIKEESKVYTKTVKKLRAMEEQIASMLGGRD